SAAGHFSNRSIIGELKSKAGWKAKGSGRRLGFIGFVTQLAEPCQFISTKAQESCHHKNRQRAGEQGRVALWGPTNNDRADQGHRNEKAKLDRPGDVKLHFAVPEF